LSALGIGFLLGAFISIEINHNQRTQLLIAFAPPVIPDVSHDVPISYSVERLENVQAAYTKNPIQ
jgi:hypothetical protein